MKNSRMKINTVSYTMNTEKAQLEALSEIQYLIDNKMLYTEDIKYVNTIKPVIKAMCLNMTTTAI